MSFNVLVIPEDCHRDSHVLEPILERVVQSIVPHARVKVCTDPRLRGVGQATKWEYIEPIVLRRSYVHLFLVVVDRDGDPDRRAKLDHLEARAAEGFGGAERGLIGVEAWQEVEVWILAGMADLPKDWSWQAVRAEVNSKEAYFDPYVAGRGVRGTIAGGRKQLAQEAAARYPRIRQLCNEVAALEDRLRAYAAGR